MPEIVNNPDDHDIDVALDVVVIGGGVAGLSGALTLARSRSGAEPGGLTAALGVWVAGNVSDVMDGVPAAAAAGVRAAAAINADLVAADADAALARRRAGTFGSLRTGGGGSPLRTGDGRPPPRPRLSAVPAEPRED